MQGYVADMEAKNPHMANLLLQRYVQEFTLFYEKLETLKKGPRRARLLHSLADKMVERASKESPYVPSCKKGCSFCCRIHATMVDSEAELIVDYLHVHDIKLSRSRCEKQSGLDDAGHVTKIPYEDRACPLLDEASGECRVYPVRPVQCRKYLVVSPAKDCDIRVKDKAAILVGRDVEALTAASMALETPRKLVDDGIASQLLKRIPKNDPLWTE